MLQNSINLTLPFVFYIEWLWSKTQRAKSPQKVHLKGIALWTSLWTFYLSGIFITWFLAPSVPALYAFGRFFYGRICHQEAERCFVINEAYSPVCGRCLGIYTALSLAGVFVLLGGYRFLSPFKNRKTRLITAFILAIFAGIDFLLSGFSFYIISPDSSGNPYRFITGILLGLSICALALPSLLYDD
jgi:uncharacterized membrane protein